MVVLVTKVLGVLTFHQLEMEYTQYSGELSLCKQRLTCILDVQGWDREESGKSSREFPYPCHCDTGSPPFLACMEVVRLFEDRGHLSCSSISEEVCKGQKHKNFFDRFFNLSTAAWTQTVR